MSLLKCEVREGIATIIFSNPPANAMSSVLFQELKALLFNLEKDVSANVVVVSGEGRFFSAGADIKEFLAIENQTHASQMSKKGQDFFEYVENYPKPIIAAIHGACLGGGMEFALACHMRIATKSAKLGLPELNLGIIPGYGGTQRLIRTVGKAKGLELMLTAEPITGEVAKEIGLVNEVVDDPFVEAMQLAKKIASKSTGTVNAVLKLTSSLKTASFHQGIEDEATYFGEVFATMDAKEGITAFIEKRKPVFEGSSPLGQLYQQWPLQLEYIHQMNSFLKIYLQRQIPHLHHIHIILLQHSLHFLLLNQLQLPRLLPLL